ncbi:MAG TPA: hypothetical protein VLF95_07585 [Vicinamibacteria bacterium]|nr:hypothetical protein [Vicinamibacteria bacterium]
MSPCRSLPITAVLGTGVSILDLAGDASSAAAPVDAPGFLD